MVRAKAQIRADMVMGLESMMRRANQMAKHLIFYNESLDLQARLKKLDEVSAEDVMRVASRIFAGTPTLAALGPLGKLEDYDAIKKRLMV